LGVIKYSWIENKNMNQKKIQLAKKFEKIGKYWEAAKLYQEALLLLNKNIGNEKEKGFCKQKIKEMNVKRSEEFTKIKTFHTFTEEEINEIQNEIHEILETTNLNYLLDKL